VIKLLRCYIVGIYGFLVEKSDDLTLEIRGKIGEIWAVK
jgi:hypothetical protein